MTPIFRGVTPPKWAELTPKRTAAGERYKYIFVLISLGHNYDH